MHSFPASLAGVACECLLELGTEIKQHVGRGRLGGRVCGSTGNGSSGQENYHRCLLQSELRVGDQPGGTGEKEICKQSTWFSVRHGCLLDLRAGIKWQVWEDVRRRSMGSTGDVSRRRMVIGVLLQSWEGTWGLDLRWRRE